MQLVTSTTFSSNTGFQHRPTLVSKLHSRQNKVQSHRSVRQSVTCSRLITTMAKFQKTKTGCVLLNCRVKYLSIVSTSLGIRSYDVLACVIKSLWKSAHLRDYQDLSSKVFHFTWALRRTGQLATWAVMKRRDRGYIMPLITTVPHNICKRKCDLVVMYKLTIDNNPNNMDLPNSFLIT